MNFRKPIQQELFFFYCFMYNKENFAFQLISGLSLGTHPKHMVVYYITFISHAKLKAYGVNDMGLHLILNYLTNYRQHTKINTSLSDNGRDIIMGGVRHLRSVTI